MRSADGEHDRVRERACAQSLRAFTSGGSACVWRDAARSPQRIRCVAQLVAVHRERVQGAALAHHARARRRLEWRRRLGLSDRVRARALSGRVRSAAPSAAAATAWQWPLPPPMLIRAAGAGGAGSLTSSGAPAGAKSWYMARPHLSESRLS